MNAEGCFSPAAALDAPGSTLAPSALMRFVNAGVETAMKGVTCTSPKLKVELALLTSPSSEHLTIAGPCPTDGGDIRAGDTVWLRPVLKED